MNQYVTGTTIKELREKNKITQVQLAEKIGVSDKTIFHLLPLRLQTECRWLSFTRREAQRQDLK